MSLAPFLSQCFDVRVHTVKVDRDKDPLVPVTWYSVVDKLIGVLPR